MAEARVDRERLLATFLDLAHLNAPSRREGAMAAHMTAHVTALGATVVTDNAGETLHGETGNLIARIPGDPALPTLLFCAHLDTVEPTEGLVIIRSDDQVSSDGATILGADDKAGLAAILEMLQVITESDMRHPPLELVFTIAEEIGLMGSEVMDYGLLTATSGFVPDSSGNVGLIITRAPAQQHLRIIIHGKAAHAGMAPETGVSAIVVAAQAIAAMRLGRIDAETTANIGVISGGKATNIIPDTVVLEGEARSRDPRKLAEQVAHMRTCCTDTAHAAGATAEVEVSDVYPAFNLADDAYPVQLATRALAMQDIPATVTATGGGSDANFINAHGIPTVILSTGYHGPHCHDERLDTHEFVKLAQWLVDIVRLAGENG